MGSLRSRAAFLVVASLVLATTSCAAKPDEIDNTLGAPSSIDCMVEDKTLECGQINIGTTTSVEFLIDGPETGAPLLWLPGGPNSSAVRTYVDSRGAVRAAYPNSRIIVVDPPRLINGGAWALDDCLTSSTQAQFYNALLGSGPGVEEFASNYAESCANSPSFDYSSDRVAEISKTIVDHHFKNFDQIDVYAASADALVVPYLLDVGISIHTLVLDSPVDYQFDGLEFIENQASQTVGVLPEIFDIEDRPIASYLSMLTTEEVIYWLTLLRVPDLTPEDRLQKAIESTVSERSVVADQYLRRYGDSQFSSLNGFYYTGVCSNYVWPTLAEYRMSQERSMLSAKEASPLVAFIYNYHLPCIYWSLEQPKPPKLETPPDKIATSAVTNAVLVSSILDPVTGTNATKSWIEALEDPHVIVARSPGHQSLLSASRCTVEELLVESANSQACNEKLNR